MPTISYASDAVRLCEAGLGGPINPSHCEVHEVRDVAPRKRMLCVSFVLPPEIAFDAEPAPFVPVLLPSADDHGNDGHAATEEGGRRRDGGGGGIGVVGESSDSNETPGDCPPNKRRRADGVDEQ